MSEDRQLSPYTIQRNFPAALLPTENQQDSLIDLRKYWRIVYKHRYLIAIIAFTLFSIAAYRTFTAPYIFTASTRIRIDPAAPKFLKLDDVGLPVPDAEYYETEFGVLRSRTMAARVIEDLKLYEDPRFVGIPASSGLIGDVIRLAGALARRSVRLLRPVLPSDKPGSGKSGAVADPEIEISNADKVLPLVDTYLNGLTITPEAGSRLVDLNYASFAPELAAQISRAHAQEYIKMTLEAGMNLNTEAQHFLEAKLGDLKHRMEESEAALNKFRREHNVLALEGNEKENITVDRLTALAQEYTRAQVERIGLESQYQLVEKRAYGSLPGVQDNPAYADLQKQLQELNAQYAELSQTLKPRYPTMVKLHAQIESIQNSLAEQIHDAVAVIESKYLAAKENEEALKSQLDQQRQTTLDLNDLSAEYQVRKRDADATRELYNTVVSRFKETDINENLKTTDVSIIDPAKVPDVPSSPQTRRDLMLGLAASLLLGLGVAYLLESLDNTVKTPDDAESLLHLASLAVIPSFNGRNKRGYGYGYGPDSRGMSVVGKAAPDNGSALTFAATKSSAAGYLPPLTSSKNLPTHKSPELAELIVVKYPRSVVAEAYRTLRTAILLSSADKPPSVIQISSAQSGEGKTVTIVNTALTLAQSGAKVLIVDADTRKSRCHHLLKVKKAPGLVDLLTGLASFENCIRSVNIQGFGDAFRGVPLHGENGDGESGDSDEQTANGRPLMAGKLDLMPSGTQPPNPAEILGSLRMREALSMLRQLYDYVLVDSPPLLPVADGLLLSAMVDGVVLVIKGQYTPTSVTKDAKSKLDKAHARIIGCVLNEIDLKSGDYSYYNRYYYSYYNQDGAEQA